MKTFNKNIAPLFLLALTIGLAYGLPKYKYPGNNLLSTLNIQSLPGWKAKDISSQIDLSEHPLNFLGHVLAMQYNNDQNISVLLLLLDADNFHYPKTCVGGAGYDARDLESIEFKLPGHDWKAKAIYFSNGKDGFLTVYWICINKKQVNWTDQKLIQLWYSLFHKQKDGFMVRLDIHANKDQIPQAAQSIQELLTSLSQQIPPESQDYLFGK